MSDAYDYIRQTHDIKEMARIINDMKARINLLENRLALSTNAVETKEITENRPDNEQSATIISPSSGGGAAGAAAFADLSDVDITDVALDTANDKLVIQDATDSNFKIADVTDIDHDQLTNAYTNAKAIAAVAANENTFAQPLILDGEPDDSASDDLVEIGIGYATGGTVGNFKIYTNYGWLEMGPLNGSWCHMNSNLNGYWYKLQNFQGGIKIANDGTTITGGVKDEDDMVSDSAVSLATQQSIKAYVDNHSFFTNAVAGTTFYDWHYLTPILYSNSTVVGSDTWIGPGNWQQSYANATDNAYYYAGAIIKVPEGWKAEIVEFMSMAANGAGNASAALRFLFDKVYVQLSYYNGTTRTTQDILAEQSDPFGTTTTGFVKYNNTANITSFEFCGDNDTISAATRTFMGLTVRYQIHKGGSASGTIGLYSHAVRILWTKL